MAVISPGNEGVMEYAHENKGVTDRAGEPRAPRLMDEVRRRIRVKHYSLRTEQAHMGWIRRFILANDKRHPRELGEIQVEARNGIRFTYPDSGVSVLVDVPDGREGAVYRHT